MHGPAVQKAIRLVNYLTGLARLRTKLIRDLAEYQKVVWLSSVPHERGCFTRACQRDEEHEPDEWLEVQNQREPGVPSVPPQCEDWVNESGVRIPLPPVVARVVRGERRLSRRNFSEGGPLPPCGHERSELRLGKPTMKNRKFFYIYILQSELDANRFHIGLTDDLRRRMRNHNAGRVLHTVKWRPWRLKTYIALSDRVRAAKFERYLKSASGQAFLKKRL
jgi:predicted GIY-YIG superfamily endonuclease